MGADPRLTSDVAGSAGARRSDPPGWVLPTVAAAVLSMALFRYRQQPLEPYGDSAAELIEHVARLRLAEKLHAGGSLLGLLRSADGMYPPGLHLVGLAVGALLGPDAPGMVVVGLGSLALLALSVAACARHLGGSAVAGSIAVLLAPCLPVVALRYYYDLPMTALLWAGAALLLSVRSREAGRRSVLAPELLGGLAGLAFVAASLVKWSALPVGLPVLVGASVTAARRTRGSPRAAAVAAIAAVATWVALSGAFLAVSSHSFSAMGGATFQPPPGARLPPADILAWLATIPGGASLQAMLIQAYNLDLYRLSFYPERLVTTLLSPVGASLTVMALAGWMRRDPEGRRGPGWPLVVCVLACGGTFLLFFVPPLDDRFILPLLPAVLLAAAIGWSRLPPPLQRLLGIAVVVGGLLLAADAHMRPSHLVVSATIGSPKHDGDVWVPRLGMSSSVYRRGWSRSDDRPPHRDALREALWAAVVRTGATEFAGPERLISARGDNNWWSWRDLLARAEQGFDGLPARHYQTWRGGIPPQRIRAGRPAAHA